MAKEPKTDSLGHTEERRAKIKQEYEQYAKQEALAEANRAEQQAAQDRKADKAELVHLEQQVGLTQNIDSRDMLLDRIREMREEKPEVHGPPPLSDIMRKQIEAEQECGRQAVAKAEAEAAQFRAARAAVEADTKKREGTMEPVHHANPGMEEQFLANKATLGKTK